MFVKLILILFVHTICYASIYDIKIYKNELSDTTFDQILAKFFTLTSEGNNSTQVALKLTDELNSKLGNGWQVMTAINANLSTLTLNHESNSLFYFSLNENHFYGFKQYNFNIAV